MKPTTTRTLNPLPFQDLEPHRFEDLVRQLAYDLRRWKSLEATGRGGSDEGIDIRAIELVPVEQEQGGEDRDDGDTDSDDAGAFTERLWVFQGKREKELGPKRLRDVVKESLVSLEAPPHGFVLAVACDISKKARDAFREEMVARGIEEFLLWAKGELEDMLFQPKNDRLLFAYFGIALQPRRRNLATSLRSEVSKKKQLKALIGDENERSPKLVLLRDPTDERYPNKPKGKGERARWVLCRLVHLRSPGHLTVLLNEHPAAVTPDGTQWDAILDYNDLDTMNKSELQSAQAWSVDDDEKDSDPRNLRSAHDFWSEYIPEAERVTLKVWYAVALESILALDPLGDGYFPIPHIFVEFHGNDGPFSGRFGRLVHVERFGGSVDLHPEKSNRTTIFPKTFPGRHDPPPAGFDDTTEPAELSKETAEKLDSLVSSLAESSPSPHGRVAASDEQLKSQQNEFIAFREWRTRVAAPVFSGFVVRLRAAGHKARVVHCSKREGAGSQAIESIELRVRIRAGNTNHRYYRAPGHLRASVSAHHGWRVNVSPERKEQRSQHYRAQPEPARETVTAETTPAQLEALTLAMLERLKSEGY